jgi:MFS family permease
MSTFASPARPSAFAVFRKRDFTLLWIGQFISTMGTALVSVAASILVYEVTGSALSVGLMLMATALPSLFVGLIAGVFVDRYDRKRIMLAAELVRAVILLCVPLLLPFSIVWLYIMVALASAVGQFYDPAHESVLPEIASDQELAAANSLMTISTIGSSTFGFAAAGLIASRYSINWAFYLDALSFVISAACIALIKIKPNRVEDETMVRVVMQNLRAGLEWVKNTRPLRSLFLLYVPVFVLFGFNNSLIVPSTMTARMMRMSMTDLPCIASLSQQALRDLRTPQPDVLQQMSNEEGSGDEHKASSSTAPILEPSALPTPLD